RSFLIFFFKQKTAYEMPKCLEFRRVLFRSAPRQADWRAKVNMGEAAPRTRCAPSPACGGGSGWGNPRMTAFVGKRWEVRQSLEQIGRASCRERVCSSEDGGGFIDWPESLGV